jgi:hypothetical protein
MGLSLAEPRRSIRAIHPTPHAEHQTSCHAYLKQAEQVAVLARSPTAHPYFGNHPRAWKLTAIETTIVFMALGLLAMHVLEVMFFVGMAGSAVVVVISFIEDAQELFGED